MTRHQQVLNLLAIAFIDRGPFLLSDIKKNIFISGGWRPVWYFVGKGRGGSAGYQRLWELQTRFGVPVEMKTHKWEYWNGEKTVRQNTPIYRLSIYDLSLTNIRQGIMAEKFYEWRFTEIKINEQIDLKLTGNAKSK